MLIEDDEEAEETEYIEKDPVRKNQTEISPSSMLLPENIEKEARINTINSKEGDGLILAPGENQIPRKILIEKKHLSSTFPQCFQMVRVDCMILKGREK